MAQLKTNNLPIICRPAKRQDTPQAIELTKNIWDGEDYVPEVWDEWIADADGLLMVAELNQRVVGFGKLTRLSSEDWWLEGLRVHPDFEGKGVASHLHDALLNHWMLRGNGIVRLATSSNRTAVHHLCQRTGFTQIGEYSCYIAESIVELQPDNSDNNFTEVIPSEVNKILNFMTSSDSIEYLFGLIELQWQWASPCDELISQLVQSDLAYWYKPKSSFVHLRTELDEKEMPSIYLTALCCQTEYIQNCLLALRKLVHSLGFDKLNWLAPLHPIIQASLVEAGFQREWNESLFIFAKNHPSK